MSLRGARGGSTAASRGGSRLSTSSPRGGSGSSPSTRGWSTPNGFRGPSAAAAPAPAPPSQAPSASAFPSLGSQTQTAQRGDDAASRTLFVLVSLVGNTVTAKTRSGQRFVGILHSTSPGDLGVSLSSAQEIKGDGTLGAPQKLLVINGGDLDIVEAHEVTLGEPVREADRQSFRTDVEISAAARPDPASRALEKWDDDGSALSGGIEDGSATNNSSKSSKPGQAWDQFAANEARFGLKSNYDEDLYTTKLDRSGKDFKEKERRAARLAAEIEGQVSSNTHMAEERGHVDDSGQNEEDKYGAVKRGPNAYVPPAARRAAASPRVVLAEAAEKKAGAAAPSIAVNVASPTIPDGDGSGATAPKATTVAAAAPAAAGGAAPEDGKSNRLHSDFKQFVSSERMRFESRKQQQTEQEKKARLAELKSWSSSFKLKTPMPEDVASVVHKSPDSKPRDPALQKSLSPAPAHAQSSSMAPTSSSGAASASTAATPAPPSTQAAQLADTKAMLSKMTIPKIPPFKAKQDGAAPAAGAAPALPSSSAMSKMSAKASSFKPFNPAAASFTPGAGAGAASSTPAAPAPPANPFFGNRPLNKSATPLHVREDFTPFKKGSSKVVPESSSIPPTWPYNGKSFRAMYTQPQAQGPAVPGTPGHATTPLQQGQGEGGGAPPVPGTPQYAPSPALVYQPQQQQQPPMGPPSGPYRFPPHGQYPMPMPHGMPHGGPGMPFAGGAPVQQQQQFAMMPHTPHNPHAPHAMPFSPPMPPQGPPATMYSPQMAAAAAAQAAAGTVQAAPGQFAAGGALPPGTPRTTANAAGKGGAALPPQMYYGQGGPMPPHFVAGPMGPASMRPGGGFHAHGQHGGHPHQQQQQHHHHPHHHPHHQQPPPQHMHPGVAHPAQQQQQAVPPPPHSMASSDASGTPAVNSPAMGSTAGGKE
ncbi:hypothetical protein BDZ90DRAFT_281072 [Jaminaea rosea]|uniref:LsmAD domain-containing protein n=1 Tax=Jaminaea rosea TaxID=1569628 RepID=A0A316UMR9_9BASI|nr:hypothetical protein BDZ90DRAFT_281072 [Jaminaea rosea]PWN26108.1 hypothetical protein BDZ90DRAFT_281072 [Jaminaea rosea]